MFFTPQSQALLRRGFAPAPKLRFFFEPVKVFFSRWFRFFLGLGGSFNADSPLEGLAALKVTKYLRGAVSSCPEPTPREGGEEGDKAALLLERRAYHPAPRDLSPVPTAKTELLTDKARFLCPVPTAK